MKEKPQSTRAQEQAKTDMGGSQITTNTVLDFLKETSLKKKRVRKSIEKEIKSSGEVSGTKIA